MRRMAMEKSMKIVLVKERKSSIYRERVSVKLKVIFFLNAQQREKFTFFEFLFSPTHTHIAVHNDECSEISLSIE